MGEGKNNGTRINVISQFVRLTENKQIISNYFGGYALDMLYLIFIFSNMKTCKKDYYFHLW